MAKKKKRGILVTLIIVGLVAAGAFIIYRKFFSGVQFRDKNYGYLYIKRNSTLNDVVDELYGEGIIESRESFEWLAQKMELEENIHAGKYRIINGMTIRKIINLIKYNKQEKVKLTFNSQIHDLEEFVDYTDEKLEISGEEIEELVEDEKLLDEYFGLDPSNAFALVVPGTCEVSWAITSDELVALLRDRYKKTWNQARISKAKKIGFSVPEIITIASIVQSESSIRTEQEKIAGVYINRLRIGMLLQADPTLKFANKNFSVQRILDNDKQINSPYNTYMYKGLPPGPICLVSQQAIDATLNFQKHSYIYFCAKPALNGYSDFSVTYAQHQKYAAAYQRALNKMGVIR